MKKIQLPYKQFKGGYYPVIDIWMKGPTGIYEVEAFVDSGASTSIFRSTVADELGINYIRGRVTYSMVGDGSYIPIYLHKVPIKIGNIWLRAAIGFSSHLGVDINLLGQKDIFDRFIVSFDKRRRIVSFQPYSRPS